VTRKGERNDMTEDRINLLVDNFRRYVEEYEGRVPFTGDQLAAHRETIALRREAGSVQSAVANGQFVSSLRRTLMAWGLGSRGSRLVPEDEFAEALRVAAPGLGQLESLVIDDVNDPVDIADRLWLAIDALGVVENQAKLVAGTKTLHHLLPDLVMPIDRAWWGRFFQLNSYMTGRRRQASAGRSGGSTKASWMSRGEWLLSST
jgi:hypothetical protein